jgi:peptidoglycan/xylan/chitin deacetylase (PgdA/CDA1 family)
MNRYRMPRRFARAAGLLCAGLLLAACRSLPVPAAATAAPVSPLPVRFLLSFDDGPSGAGTGNTTEQILDTLAHNRWQPGIKAIFFVQTRHRLGGATEVGQRLLRRMHREGHLVSLHTASPRGHINHTQMPLEELDRTLEDGIEDIRRITGDVPRFIRPPYWAHNDATLARYQAHGLTMLLDDVSIRDGKVRGYTSNPNARERIRADLVRAAERIRRGDIPAVNGYLPLVMTLHDTNPTTARDLEAYLGMLIEEARGAGLAVHAVPFVSPDGELVRVASVRGRRPVLVQASDQRRPVLMSP